MTKSQSTRLRAWRTTQDDMGVLTRVEADRTRVSSKERKTQYLPNVVPNVEPKVQFTREDLGESPSDESDNANSLLNLGVSINNRYRKTRAISDLEDSIRVTRKGLGKNPTDYERALLLSNLGVQFNQRYELTTSMTDRDEAIRAMAGALEYTPKDSPDRCLRLTHLAGLLGDRYSKKGSIIDLEKAIQLQEEAVLETNSPNQSDEDKTGVKMTLRHLLRQRYQAVGALADLEQSIRVCREVIKTAPNGVIWPDRWSDLAENLLERYDRLSTKADLEESVKSAKSHLVLALGDSNVPIGIRINAGKTLTAMCGLTNDWQQAYETANCMAALVPQVSSKSLETTDRQYAIGNTNLGAWACDAAASALHAGKGPVAALNFLEQGRGALAASFVEIRADVQYLHAKYPELADRFVHLRDKLDLPPARMAHTSTYDTRVTQRHNVSKEFDSLITEIRKQSGFEDFLLATSEEKMRNAAKDGPIVVINTCGFRCDAILVEQHQIRSIALPGLKGEDINEKSGGELWRPKVLEWLWDVLARPVLEALGFTRPPDNDAWPHVWWVTTAALARFPLHAAGYHKDPGNSVLDRVMSSYSPSIKAIIHGRQRLRVRNDGMHSQALLAQLPFAAKEIQVLAELCNAMALKPVEPRPRKQDILSHLSKCEIFHFAGHGHTDITDPSMSQLLLEDWATDSLTVSSLLEMNLYERPPFLAYLSACGTGEIAVSKFYDENIHLVSACQLAGFRHVIGTLWEVNDESCVDIARITYQEIASSGMTDKTLRERWICSSKKARREVLTAEVGMTFLTKTACRGDQRDDNLSRKAVLYDSDDEDDEPNGLPYWVPYVHFGV
ncbi:CHAT domain-containing protein [Hypoxylon crocopeplum]|nr:CHAT domain-containing protein [Hypoxylon crocopeplum]